MKNKPYNIKRLDQITSLATSARQEIIDTLHVIGPASVAEIASHLGRAADSLYHHIRILQRVDLIVNVGKRQTDVRDKMIYDIPGRPMQVTYDLADQCIVDGITEVTAAMLRITDRDFLKALKSSEVTVNGPYRNIRASRMKGWLDAAQIRELNSHIEAIKRLFASPKGRRQARIHSFTLVLSPSESSADKARRH